MDTINSQYLFQFVQFPTYNKNTLDLIFSEKQERISNINRRAPLSSSTKNILHSSITWDFILNAKFDSNVQRNKKYNYSKGNYRGISSQLSKISFDENMNVNDMYELFISNYNDAIDKNIPYFYVGSSDFSSKKWQPKWLNQELRKLIKKKYSLRMKMLASSKDPIIKSTVNKLSRLVKKR